MAPPVILVIAAAHVHDRRLVQETLTGLRVPRPVPTDRKPQNLCLDNGYAYDFVRRPVELLRFVPHIRPIGGEADEIPRDLAHPPKRWKVERTASCIASDDCSFAGTKRSITTSPSSNSPPLPLRSSSVAYLERLLP
jgi:hypothetical protein